MKKPLVLIIENSIDVTGALKSITRSACDLHDTFDFAFLLPKHTRGRFWVEAKGFNDIDELPMREVSRRIKSLILYIPFLLINAFRLNQILQRRKVDLMHVNDLYNLLPVVTSLLGNKTPYVCHIRFLPDKFPKILFEFWLGLHLKYASRIIAVSNAVMEKLPRHPKIDVVYNELPVEERYPELIEPMLGKDSFTFLYLANFIDGKGQNYALEAFAKVNRDLPNWKLRFVGGDMGLEKNKRFRTSLQQRAVELDIFDKTEWIGFTEEVEWEYKQADVVLNFSESESFSITCLEALFFGRPLIATACGGPSEIVDHESTGLLVQNRNVKEMELALRKLANNASLRYHMGKVARERVRSKFCFENTSYRFRSIYKSILIRVK